MAQVVPRMAKSGCQEYCGDVLIPYPFGIGSSEDCYLDDWFEIECSNQSSKTTSSAPHYKPVLKQAQLEVLNISIEGTLQVNSNVTFFCNETESSPMANLTGSPFVYSQEKTDSLQLAAASLPGCISRVVVDYHSSISHYDALPLYTKKTQNADCDDYAFLVDKDWFERSSSAHAVKSRSNVPVGRPYCLGSPALDYNNRSTFLVTAQLALKEIPIFLKLVKVHIDECMIGHNRCGPKQF
ncbi:wall associated kinase-like 7 [Prunus dulcis]|uniref:Wall associated kinase-like 7 n=1 Tax=Prunus dulcis TaxID=3755 RepID=A0A4Y1QXJ0_PRUDU|nr:wall associated kinase-like 7 [Prunus dulcis]